MNRNKRDWLLIVISWMLAVLFLILFFLYVGFPPRYPAEPMDWCYLAIALVFIVFPFITKLQLGNLLKLEKEIERTNKDLDNQRQYTNQMISLCSASITSIANMQNTVNINMGKNPDTTVPTSLNEIEKNAAAQIPDLDYRKTRMAYSMANEDSREDISADSLDWIYCSNDLFWLGQNLTYIKAVFISGGPKHLIELALRQAYTHMKNLGLQDSISIRSIVGLLITLDKLAESEINLILREQYAQIVQECIYRIGGLSSDYQDLHLTNEIE